MKIHGTSYNPATTSPAAITEAIKDAGYGAELVLFPR
jgi:hypothetical protein